MIHKYKPCAWHVKKRRVNKTIGQMIAKKYGKEYVEPTRWNKLTVGMPRKIIKSFQSLGVVALCLGKRAGSAIKKMKGSFIGVKLPQLK